MRTAAIGFLSGILFLTGLSDLPDPFFVSLLPILILLAIFSSRATGIPRAVPMLAWVGAGFLWALLRAESGVSNILPEDLEGHDLVLDGIIVSVPARSGPKTGFLLDIVALKTSDHDFHRGEWGPGQRIRLNWYGRSPRLLPGERWRLTARLKRPNGFRNPGGFDYEKWLFRQGIRATGYVKSRLENRKLQGEDRFSLDHVRYRLAQLIRQHLADSPHAGIVKALAIGVRDDVTQEQWATLRSTGTAHLMAISGLHIGLITTLIFFGIRKTLPTGMALVMPAQRTAALVATVGALGYAALAGFSLPTVRALIMVCVVMAGVFWRRHTAVGASLALALFAVLLLTPLAVLSIGFWLSFVAVAVILFGMTGHLSVRNLWWRWGRVQVLIAVGLLPLTLLFFQQHPLASPIANLVAIPWVGFVVVPLVLVGTCLVGVFPDLGGFLLGLGDSAIAVIWPFLQGLESLDFVYRKIATPPLWAVLAGGIGVILLLLPRGMPGRWLGVIWLLPLFFIPAPRPNNGEIWFHLLDVGQGLAAVVRTREHVLIYDVGPAYSANFNAGGAVLVPFLQSQDIQSVDRVIVSHRDRDHIGGLKSLLEEFPIDTLMTNAPLTKKSASLHPRGSLPCRDGMKWHWDGVDFRILHPPPGRKVSGNNDSCVLSVSGPAGTILLPGDIEHAAEQRLLRDHAKELDVDILVAPHHGSGTSSSRLFIRAVTPRHALFSVGYRNRFGLPTDAVMTRYRQSGARLLSSDRHGTITFHLTPGKGISAPDTHRQEARHFWHR
nr:MAG: competence protein ComEC [Candidatus Kentron sp. FW]